MMTATTLGRFNALSGSPLLTAFYDGSCGICSAEMAALHELDHDDAIALVDCAAPSFDGSLYATEGVTREAMLQALHVRDILGDWHRGVDAIALLYATAGAPRLARLWAHPLTRPFAQWLYPIVVRHRHALSELGLNFVSPRVLRLFASRRARCDHASCRA